MKAAKYGLEFITHFLFFAITAIFPKNRKLWIFGCWGGKIYADNSKYLFEWINKNQPQINTVWLSNNIDVVQHISKLGYKAYKIGTISAFWSLARAGAIIETEGNSDIGGYRPGRCKIIQLWHGVAPKKMNYRKKYNTIATIMRNVIFDNHEASYWMVSSEQNKGVMQDFFNIPDNHVYVTGYPRNDQFLVDQSDSPVIRMLNREFPGYKKIIYMPTHRNFGNNDVAYFSDDDMIKINSSLVKHNIVMVFKPHVHELQNYVRLKTMLTNIVLATDINLYSDVYSYINSFDLLISDYSSIEYDFLCSGKPIVLFPYDLESFKISDGLFDYFERMPCGPFCMSWDEVLKKTQELLTNDSWYEKREKCRIVFHPFLDGKNSQRVYLRICELLKIA